jgi:hypothetical protein
MAKYYTKVLLHSTLINEIKRIDKYILFGFLSIITALLNIIISNWLFHSDLFFMEVEDQLALTQVQAFLDNQYKYQWLAFLILPFIYLLKLSLLALVLLAGAIFWNIKISFIKLFQIALIAEFLFIIPSLVKLVWFLFFDIEYELIDLQTFYPLSLVNLIDVKDVPQWSLYPLQLVNIFEFAYWWILAYGISLVAKERWSKMLGLVASSYGVGLFVWVVFITFITINLS